jgi:hypothetical protein
MKPGIDLARMPVLCPPFPSPGYPVLVYNGAIADDKQGRETMRPVKWDSKNHRG